MKLIDRMAYLFIIYSLSWAGISMLLYYRGMRKGIEIMEQAAIQNNHGFYFGTDFQWGDKQKDEELPPRLGQ